MGDHDSHPLTPYHTYRRQPNNSADGPHDTRPNGFRFCTLSVACGPYRHTRGCPGRRVSSIQEEKRMSTKVEHIIRVYFGSTLQSTQAALQLVRDLGAPDDAVVSDQGDGPARISWTEVIEPGDTITKGPGRPVVGG